VSRRWKIVVGVIAAVVVAGVVLAAWGAVTFRNRVYEHGWGPRAHQWGPEAMTQLEVRLVDDDGDGVPDRGVIEMPEDLRYGCGYGPSILRRGSRRAMPMGGPHFGRGFGPFPMVGGLFRLAFLALLIGLGVACFHRWSRAKGTGEPQGG
jgi:hypothetical protein